jgi:hypothetical protein
MKRFQFFLTIPAYVLLLLGVNSCREEFLPGFKDVTILNAPPAVKIPIGEVTLITGFTTYSLDLSNYVFDPEGDPLSVTVTSSNDEVVTIKVNGTVLEITEVGEGTCTVTATITDGNEGNVTTTEFDIVVALPSFVWYTTFDLPDGTDLQGLSYNGATFSYEGYEGASITVHNGALVWVVPEWCGLTIEFDEPLDLSANSLFQFDYADMFGEEIWFGFGDAEGAEVWDIFFADEFGGSFMLNNPGFNTFDEFYLEDFADWEDPAVDVSQVSYIYFEMAGAEKDDPSVWRVDNIFIGNLEE